MGRYLFRLPDIGEGVAEAEITAWHVKPGDHIAEDGPLLDVMTDKATVDMTSPVEGIVTAIHGEVGSMAPVGSVLVEMDVAGEAPAERGKSSRSQTRCDAECARGGSAGCRTVANRDARQFRSHRLARHAAPRHGMGHQTGRREGHRSAWPHPGRGSGAASRPAESRAAHQNEKSGVEEIKLVGMRRKIADRMAQSKRQIPHFSYVEEFDLTELEALRADLNANRSGQSAQTDPAAFLHAGAGPAVAGLSQSQCPL